MSFFLLLLLKYLLINLYLFYNLKSLFLFIILLHLNLIMR